MGGKIVIGRAPETRIKVEGYGVKFMGDRTFVVTNDGEKEIIPSSVRIRLDEQETVVTEVMTQEQISEMHNLLVQTVIDYLRTNNITNVDEVTFSADGLQTSIEYGAWTPATDSCLHLYGYEDGKNKLVGFSM